MEKLFYGIYDYGKGDFNARWSGELPVVIFDTEEARENWINCPDELAIEWEKEFEWYRKPITAEQARDALSHFGWGCDWIITALEADDTETIKAVLGWDSFELPVELDSLDLNNVKLPKKYCDDTWDAFGDDMRDIFYDG